MYKMRPPKEEIILELAHSYGGLWFVEPPMYDAYCEVVSSVQVGNRCKSVLNHFTVTLEEIDELFQKNEITATKWIFELSLTWSEKTQEWAFEDGGLVNDMPIKFAELSHQNSILSGLFEELDIDEYLYDTGMSSKEFWAKLKPIFKPFYKPK